MTTFGELVTQTGNALRSFTGLHEQMTWLSGSLSSSATSATVNNGEKVNVGVVEIGEELLYVSSVATNTLTIAPFGRGYRGSTAAAHAANDPVVVDPVFPVVEVKKALNQTLASVYPLLYQVKETTFTFTGAQATYELPAEADGVVKVQWETIGSTGYWAPIEVWEFHRDASTATGRALTLHEVPLAGCTVKVTYRANFAQFASNADTFADVGLPESALDVLVYGAASHLLRFLDVARLQVGSVENLSRAQVVASGDPSRIANGFYSLYSQRLAEERKKLLELDPPQIHFTR